MIIVALPGIRYIPITFQVERLRCVERITVTKVGLS